MKTGFKRFLSYALMATLSTTIIACGSKNKIGGTNAANTFAGTAVSLPTTAFTQISSLKASYPCYSGARIELNYSASGTTNAYSQTTISGTFTRGGLTGTATAVYVGMSTAGDLMIISQVGSAFNINLSMCPLPGLMQPGHDLREFVAPNGITMMVNTSAPFGKLSAANTRLANYSIQSWIPTSFYPVASYGY